LEEKVIRVGEDIKIILVLNRIYLKKGPTKQLIQIHIGDKLSSIHCPYRSIERGNGLA